MKFSFTFKTPDVTDSISKYDVEYYMEENPHFETADEAIDDIQNFLSKWLKYGELVTITFDTVAQTAVVCKNK
mgnify:CR=1 FL=1